MKKKKIEEIKKELKKQEVKQFEIQRDRYAKAIARYCFVDFATTGSSFEEMWMEENLNTLKIINKAKISEKEKKRLRKETFLFHRSGKYKGEENEFIKSQISFAKMKLDGLGDDKKLEIVKDCLGQKAMWSKMMSINYILRKEIDEIKQKKRKNGITKRTINRKRKRN